MKPSRIWRAFEAAPGLVRSSVDWRRLLGPDYAKLHPHLRPKQGLAGSILCPAKPRCGCLHGVVEHKRDDLVSVCRCFPRRCRTAPLERADAVVYELHRGGLGGALSGALGIKAGERVLRGMHATWQIGTYVPRAGLRIPFYLTVQSDPEDFKLAVTSLAASDPGPFVLLAPTEDFWKSEYYDLLRAKKARFLALAEIMEWNGKLTAMQPLADILSDLLEEVLPRKAGEFELQCEGATWRAVFRGEACTVPDSKGMAYIALLLSNPNKEIHSTQLHGEPVNFGHGLPAQEPDNDEPVDQLRPKSGKRVHVDAVQDAEGAANYKRRLKKIKEQIEEARELGNTEQAAILAQEEHDLTKGIARSIGYGGQSRREGPAKKARQAVSKAIKTALAGIKTAHPALHQHLETALKLGEFLKYQPDDGVRWMVRSSTQPTK